MSRWLGNTLVAAMWAPVALLALLLRLLNGWNRP